MSDKKRNEGMNEEIEITHADDLEETGEVVVFTKEEFEALMAEDLEQFIQRVKRNSELTELTPYALHELVKAVYVEAPDKSSGKRKQKIHICYDLVGFIPVDILAKAEQA